MPIDDTHRNEVLVSQSTAEKVDKEKTPQFELFPGTQLVKKCDEMDDDKMKTYHDHLVLKNRVCTA